MGAHLTVPGLRKVHIGKKQCRPGRTLECIVGHFLGTSMSPGETCLLHVSQTVTYNHLVDLVRSKHFCLRVLPCAVRCVLLSSSPLYKEESLNLSCSGERGSYYTCRKRATELIYGALKADKNLNGRLKNKSPSY